MINIYFGLPRTGKTTLFTKLALDESKKIDSGKSKYRLICGNVELDIPHYQYIEFDMLGKYDFSECLILIDEATIECDSREFKVWSKDKTKFFVLHGHWKCNICCFVQIYNRLDKTIRDITVNVYYMWKPFLLGYKFTRYVRIPYGIDIPKKSKGDSESESNQISMGYYCPSIIDKLFAKWLYRPKYYQYFDSYCVPSLPPIPEIKYRVGEVIPYFEFEEGYIPDNDIDIRSHLL